MSKIENESQINEERNEEADNPRAEILRYFEEAADYYESKGMGYGARLLRDGVDELRQLMDNTK
jgi:N-methylhydantoinase B/oxoprolinase/acetone carboxylase alpha subunit